MGEKTTESLSRRTFLKSCHYFAWTWKPIKPDCFLFSTVNANAINWLTKSQNDFDSKSTRFSIYSKCSWLFRLQVQLTFSAPLSIPSLPRGFAITHLPTLLASFNFLRSCCSFSILTTFARIFAPYWAGYSWMTLATVGWRENLMGFWGVKRILTNQFEIDVCLNWNRSASASMIDWRLPQ